MFYAGHLLVLMIWVQNVMTDLIIVKEDESILDSFNYESERIEFRDKRIEYWQKSFPEIKKKFIELFPSISERHSDKLLQLQHIRDFFAHARYSLKFPLIRYQPTATRRDLVEKVSILTKVPYSSENTFLKVELTEEKYNEIYDFLMIFENEIFPEIGEQLNIDINRFK